MMWRMLACVKRQVRVGRSRATAAALLLLLTLYYFTWPQQRLHQDLAHKNYIVQMTLLNSVMEENGGGCEPIKTDPFSEEIMKFYDMNVPKVVCPGTDWVQCYHSQCFVIKEMLEKLNDISCIYKDIIYVHDHDIRLGEPVKVRGSEKYKLNKSDHVKVSCSGQEKTGLHLMATRWFGYKAGFRPLTTPSPIPPPSPPSLELSEAVSGNQDLINACDRSVDVLILAFDSISRNSFIRCLPKTLKYLTNELNATIFNIFNVVGDGTPGALYPILTGKNELELPDTRVGLSNNFIDEKHFIFHKVKQHGYRTAYFEDRGDVGTFQYKYNGFERQPADHYYRPFDTIASRNYQKWYSGSKKRHCIGAMPDYLVMLNLTRQFFDLTANHFCFTFISGLSHDDSNLISTLEDDVVSFLQDFKDAGRLENTLIIVMGDHGYRFNGIRDTYQGKLEERLPFLAVILPESIKKCRPEAQAALEANANVLTTFFDMHTSILDVLGLTQYSNEFRVQGSRMARGLSWLRRIPRSRSCGEAGVLPHWCVCTKWHTVPRLDPMFAVVAIGLADYINNLTSHVRHLCAERQLDSVEWMMEQSPYDELLKYRVATPLSTRRYYQVKLVMSPGLAAFEGTVRAGGGAALAASERDISRVNSYHDEAGCVSDSHPHLLKYCYCRNGTLPWLYKTMKIGVQ